jgi:protein-S-isoprenylcysteine O-methyltransferase Ste14
LLVTTRYAIASVLVGLGVSALSAKALAPSGAEGLPSSLLIAGIILAMVGGLLLWTPRG